MINVNRRGQKGCLSSISGKLAKTVLAVRRVIASRFVNMPRHAYNTTSGLF